MHHHLTRAGVRLAGSILVETGEAREIHHIAALIGYRPTLMLDDILRLVIAHTRLTVEPAYRA